MRPMRDFQRGLLATLPLAPGVIAFGLLYGVMARQVGLSPWEAGAMSLIVHAGSAQFIAARLFGMGTPGLIIVLTTLAVNSWSPYTDLVKRNGKMTGEQERNDGRCPLCRGRLVSEQKATVPFVLENTVAVIKDVPAEVCASCHESYMTGEVTDRVIGLLKQLRSLHTEVSIISYSALPRAA